MADSNGYETHLPDPMHHVQDASSWEIWERMFGGYQVPLLKINFGVYEFELTKFMVLELLAAALVLLIFVPLARLIRGGGLPRGRYWNAFEALLVFVRDEIARPNLDAPENGHGHGHDEDHGHGHGHGHEKAPAHEADKYVPFLWTLFLFILFMNLLGMIPLLGSPTASIWVTGGLAIISFLVMHGAAIWKVGPIRYVKSLYPHIDVGVPGLGHLFSLPLFLIEMMGTVIKSGVLAVRLFANMFAGHLVLANVLLFIQVVGNASLFLWGGVTAITVLGVVALSLLELFVAFLQAYVFTFLTALFMGMSLHPEH